MGVLMKIRQGFGSCVHCPWLLMLPFNVGVHDVSLTCMRMLLNIWREFWVMACSEKEIARAEVYFSASCSISFEYWFMGALLVCFFQRFFLRERKKWRSSPSSYVKVVLWARDFRWLMRWKALPYGLVNWECKFWSSVLALCLSELVVFNLLLVYSLSWECLSQPWIIYNSWIERLLYAWSWA